MTENPASLSCTPRGSAVQPATLLCKHTSGAKLAPSGAQRVSTRNSGAQRARAKAERMIHRTAQNVSAPGADVCGERKAENANRHKCQPRPENHSRRGDEPFSEIEGHTGLPVAFLSLQFSRTKRLYPSIRESGKIGNGGRA